MSSLVIVAIPAEDDVVHQISSEKVPHLTLMYLGETSEDKNTTRMAEFVEHALKLNGHGPFWLEVDYRGELGEDKADVLFFEGGWEAKWIKSLRGQLLQQSDIRAAYQSEEQFPDWVPHLTLGYPGAPAKPIPDDHSGRLYSVRFDRIAVWDGNYEGPEFRLKREEDQLVETHGSTWDGPFSLHSAEFDEEALAHYGVKGMRWGVRKDDSGSGQTTGTPGGPKSEAFKKGVKKAVDFAGDIQFENMANDGRARQRILEDGKANWKKEDLPALKTKHAEGAKLKNRLLHPLDPQTKAYRKDAKETYIKQLEKTANNMTNFSGTRQYTIRERGIELPAEGGALPKGRYFWDVTTRQVKHAVDGFDATTTMELILDEDGFIVDMVEQDSATHALELGGDFLEHYGVKGMRWGVRKDDGGGVGSGAGGKKTDMIKRGIKEVVKISGDIQFENMALDGRAREKIVQEGKKAWKQEDLPGLRQKHGESAKLKNRLLHPLDSHTKAYRKDARETYIKQLEKTANSMKNYSGDREFTIRERGIELPARGGKLPTSRYFWDVSTRQVKHDGFDGTTTVELILDDDGFIVDLVQQDSAAAHSATLDLEGSTQMIGATFLEHFGIKGMRWGVRKGDEPKAVTPEANSRVPHGDKRQTKIEVKGGENHPAAPDAIKVAQTKAKYRKSGPNALTNQELRELQERMNLEANVNRLVAPASNVEKGRRFVKQFTSANKEFNDTARTSMETVRLVKTARA